ncbi:MAG: arylamine N-acetyltransferase [Oscillospiraceae bacterium]|nr:arylamine N-acetyltransferase [Oscillospiraceae bacterium]
MYEEVLAPLPDAGAYLDRIGYDGSVTPSRGTLDALILAHQLSVPFENLTVYDGDANVSLAVRDLYDKIVVRRRGGYCFELNGLFCSLLLALGFDCRPVAGRVLWGKPSRGFVGHRATLVSLEGRRLFCDVGFGGPMPDLALDIDEPSVQRCGRDAFFFTPSEYGETMLNRETPDGGEALISFSTAQCDARDFLPLNYYYDYAPASYFRSKRMVNLRTEDGFAAIDGDRLRLRSGGTVKETRLTTPQEINDALTRHFGIDFKVERV